VSAQFENGRFENKVAIVTGAAGGIGSATVRRLASEGAKVVAADILADRVDELAAKLRGEGLAVIATAVDVEDEARIAEMVGVAVREFGGLDVLHNNAALQLPEVMARDGSVTDIDADLFARVLRVNLFGYVLGAKHAIPHMLERGGGVIVNTASGTGVQAELARPMYGTSKAAVIGFTRNVATQFGKQGIRCVAIAPGLIETSSLRANMPDEVQARFRRHFLTPYLGSPEDIASAVAFLASDEARFITGITLSVDGGFSVHTPSYVDELELFAGHEPGSR
jgi:NAD(P)-dependent dehydrogenase (short-subunit alcohol dehydrogenase family)